MNELRWVDRKEMNRPILIVALKGLFDAAEAAKRTERDNARLVNHAISAVILILALGFHVAEVGLI